MHYERLPRWPERFVVVGDAVCCFNPVYGQGMTVSALEAQYLGSALGEQRHRSPNGDLAGFARRFQRRLPKTVNPVWQLATGEDFRWPTTEGPKRGRLLRFMHWYVDQLFDALASDAHLVDAFSSVMHLLEPPIVLFRPDVFMPVMRQALRARLRRASRVRGDRW